MRMKTAIIPSLLGLALIPTTGLTQEDLTDKEQLGKAIFFDNNLSINKNQSCATCHAPNAGWTGPDSALNAAGTVYEGSIPDRFGNRKPPSSAYATQSPILHFVIEKQNNKNKASALFVGGNFWDGRATGEKLGNPAADQAQGPFLNPLEQALPDAACVVYRVCNAIDYDVSLDNVFSGSCTIAFPTNTDSFCTAGEPVPLDESARAKVNTAYDNIAYAIKAFEASPESNAFTSKYDAYLKGQVDLTKEEKQGLNLFKSKGKCAACHVLDPGPNGSPLLTDYTYDNLGIPRNPDNPFYDEPEFNPAGAEWIDLGLGEFLDTRSDYKTYAAANYGKQKVPTLRNVDLRPAPDVVKAYSHNGYFKSLKQIVHFYNTRDAKPTCVDAFTRVGDAIAQGCWPVPEVPANVNTKELGNLHLTAAQEDLIVAFLKTLSDGYFQP